MTATAKRKHPAKILPLTLPSNEYHVLEEIGRREERDAVQHARWVLRQYIASTQQNENGEAVTDVTR